MASVKALKNPNSLKFAVSSHEWILQYPKFKSLDILSVLL